MKVRLVGCSLLIGFALCAPAFAAEEAVTSKDANLRAGPGRDYPVVAQIPEGSSVQVAGCLDDYAWCDVVTGPDRGWVYSGNLEYPYEGRRVAILQEGPAIGLPIVTFSVGSYWDNYCRGRPWYGRRSYFSARPLPEHRVWVRPSGTRVDRSPGVAPSNGTRYSTTDRRSQPRPAVVRPQGTGNTRQRDSGPRASAPQFSGQPQPSGQQRRNRGQVQQPSRPEGQKPAQAQPQPQPKGQKTDRGRPQEKKPQEEKKHGN